MQKAKFEIKGMHCHSCAKLIENELKGRNGVISARVNFDSKKGAVVFDEQKIKEGDILHAVSESGDYQAEAIKQPAEEGESFQQQKQSFFQQPTTSPKTSFILGLLTSFLFFSLLLNIVFGVSLARKSESGAEVAGAATNQGQNLPSPSPSPAPAAIQAFEITKDNHVRGKFDAPITLVEFSDFECPFCERHYPTLKKILADYPDKVRLVYKHFPLSIHPNSQKAAEASECANEQNKFWEYHDKLFDNQPSGYSTDKFKQWAKDLNLDSNKFNDCLDSGKYASKVQTDFQEGNTKGVQGTPATYVNGQLISGALPYESFKQAIDAILNNE